jgi:hypothetical protein
MTGTREPVRQGAPERPRPAAESEPGNDRPANLAAAALGNGGGRASATAQTPPVRPRRLIALQRAVGNQVILRWLRSSGHHVVTRPVLQRQQPPAQPPAGNPFAGKGWSDLLPKAHGRGGNVIASVKHETGKPPALIYVSDTGIVKDPAAGAPSATDPALTQQYEAAVSAVIAGIVAGRAAIPARDIGRDPNHTWPATHSGNYYDPTNPGWKPKDDPKIKDDDWPGELKKRKASGDLEGAAYQQWVDKAVPTGVDLKIAEQKRKWDIFKNTIPLEGNVGTITTFDRTLSVGVGFSSSAGQTQSVIGRTFDALPDVKAVALAAGLIADAAGGMRVVDTDRKWILDGQDAAAYAQTNEALLSLLVNVSQGRQPGTSGKPLTAAEQESQRQVWLDAQWQTFLNNALAGIPSTILNWPLDSAVLATHSRHGTPAYFPWSFWQAHPNSNLKAMMGAMYDQLKANNAMSWFLNICDGKYRAMALQVQQEKEEAAAKAKSQTGSPQGGSQ